MADQQALGLEERSGQEQFTCMELCATQAVSFTHMNAHVICTPLLRAVWM